MLIGAEIVYKVKVRLDIPENTNTAETQLMILKKSSEEFVSGNFEKRIVQCIERPEVVDKE